MGDKNLKMDFLLIFSKEPSEFATFCTKFESDPSIEHQEIKKIRWVCHNRPGPLLLLYKIFLLDMQIQTIYCHVESPIKWKFKYHEWFIHKETQEMEMHFKFEIGQ